MTILAMLLLGCKMVQRYIYITWGVLGHHGASLSELLVSYSSPLAAGFVTYTVMG